MWAATTPPNYDFTAWMSISDTVLSGGNPYETGKHVYGPPWFLLNSAIRAVFHDEHSYRLALAAALSVADIAIALLLAKRNYLLPACLFLVAPITIAITGQHEQFDNIAIALALASALLVRKAAKNSRLAWADWASVLLLGLSLSTKHIFIVLPLWFALRQTTWLRRLFYLAAPLAVFLATLLPYWILNSKAVIDSIVAYRSNPNAPFYYVIFPDELVWGLVNQGRIVLFFLAILAALSFLYRRLASFEATLVYAISVVVFSTAIVDQYLAIPMAGVAVFLNLGFFMWLGFSTIYLLGEPADINLPIFNTLKLHVAPYPELAAKDQFVFLFLGWIIMNFTLAKRWGFRAPGAPVGATAGDKVRLTQ